MDQVVHGCVLVRCEHCDSRGVVLTVLNPDLINCAQVGQVLKLSEAVDTVADVAALRKVQLCVARVTACLPFSCTVRRHARFYRFSREKEASVVRLEDFFAARAAVLTVDTIMLVLLEECCNAKLLRVKLFDALGQSLHRFARVDQ